MDTGPRTGEAPAGAAPGAAEPPHAARRLPVTATSGAPRTLARLVRLSAARVTAAVMALTLPRGSVCRRRALSTGAASPAGGAPPPEPATRTVGTDDRTGRRPH